MESALADAVGLVSCVFSPLEELVPASWLLQLDLFSLKGSAVSIVGFGVSMGSGYLWAVVLAFVVLGASIPTAASEGPSQLICSAASPLLVPGIIAGASVPLFRPALLAGTC